MVPGNLSMKQPNRDFVPRLRFFLVEGHSLVDFDHVLALVFKFRVNSLIQ